MRGVRRGLLAVLLFATAAGLALAADIKGAADHPALTRYPGSTIKWQTVRNFATYKVPLGPVTGYRQIGKWEEIEGRVTRTLYTLDAARSHGEVYANYRRALREAGFAIIAQGLDPAKNGDVGSRQWLQVYYINNPLPTKPPATLLTSGTSTQGGAGAVFGKAERAGSTLYALVSLEQHSAELVVVLVDIIETRAAETGLVRADAEAMGKNIAATGRTVLEGLYFDTDKAVLKPQSRPALAEIARFLKSTQQRFYVVGHTDSEGAFAYNQRLSAQRASAVKAALEAEHGVPSSQLSAHGVGPLSPRGSNAAEVGKAQNRRVELVAQ